VASERQLSEKRRSRDLPSAITAVPSAPLDDLDPAATLAPGVLAKKDRTMAQQLWALGFAATVDTQPQKPTVLRIIVVGKDVIGYVAGAYIN